MAKELRSPRIPAQDLLERYDALWSKNWPTRVAENNLANYANGGMAPNLDPQELCDQDPLPVPLGYAARWFKDILTPIQSAIRLAPGPIEMQLKYPKDYQKAQFLNQKTNDVVNDYARVTMQRTLDIAAGRMLLTGKACLFRASKYDTFMQNGRILVPDTYPDDPKDSGFREWGFMADLKLQQVDKIIGKLMKDGGDAGTTTEPTGPISKGWQLAGIKQLKKWILSDPKHRYPSDQDDWPTLLLQPFPYNKIESPTSVYWVFRKSGRFNKKGRFQGDESVDLYCISRYGCASGVSTWEGDRGVKYSAMKVNNQVNNKDEQGPDARLLYYCPDAFDSVDEALALIIDDQRIDGEQYIGDVRGSGQVALPRLQAMEGLIYDSLEGVRASLIPLWTISGTLDEEFRRTIERQRGLSAHQMVPGTFKPMERNNALPPIAQAMQIAGILGQSINQDAQRETSRSREEFASENNLQVEQLKTQTNLRVQRFNDGVRPYYRGIVCSLLRPYEKSKMRHGDPCYYESQRIYKKLEHCGIKPSEVEEKEDEDTWEVLPRIVSGGMEKMEAIKANLAMTAQCAQYYPQAVPFFLRQASIATFGEPVTRGVFPMEQYKDDKQDNQQQIAEDQSTECLVLLIPVPREKSDNPSIHAQVHMGVLGKRIQPLLQSGSASILELQGIAALIAHTMQDAAAMPRQAGAQIAGMLQKASQALSQLEITGQKPAIPPEKAAALQIQAGREQRLKENDQKNAQFKEWGMKNKEQDLLLRSRAQLENEKSQEVNRAKTYLDIAHTAAAGPPPVERGVAALELSMQERELEMANAQTE